MTTQNAADYLPAVEALRDGELQARYGTKWIDCSEANFTEPPDHYRRRPKPREWWLIKDSYGAIGISAIPVQKPGDYEVVHVREVLP